MSGDLEIVSGDLLEIVGGDLLEIVSDDLLEPHWGWGSTSWNLV